MYLQNLKRLGLLTFVCGFLLAFALALQEDSAQYIFQCLYAGHSLYLVTEKVAFLFVVILLQSYNAKLVVYSLSNLDYLSIRYPSMERYYWVLVRRLALNAGGFWLSLLAGAMTGLAAAGMELALNLPEMLLLSYALYLALALGQVLLLTRFREAEAFGILSVVGFVLTMVTPWLPRTLPVPLWLVELAALVVIIVGELVYLLFTLKRKWIA